MGHLHICAPSVSTVALPGCSSRNAGRLGGLGSVGGPSRRASTTRRGALGIVCAAGRGGRGALNAGRAGWEGCARPEIPRRCTFPMTPLRVVPPSCLAIWLAESPSSHNFFSVETLSSVHDTAALSFLVSPTHSAMVSMVGT